MRSKEMENFPLGFFGMFRITTSKDRDEPESSHLLEVILDSKTSGSVWYNSYIHMLGDGQLVEKLTKLFWGKTWKVAK